jgi:hypothetical protein
MLGRFFVCSVREFIPRFATGQSQTQVQFNGQLMRKYFVSSKTPETSSKYVITVKGDSSKGDSNGNSNNQTKTKNSIKSYPFCIDCLYYVPMEHSPLFPNSGCRYFQPSMKICTSARSDEKMCGKEGRLFTPRNSGICPCDYLHLYSKDSSFPSNH